MYKVNLDKLARHLEETCRLPWAHASYVGDPNQGVIHVTYKDNPKKQYILGAGAPVLGLLFTEEKGKRRKAQFQVNPEARRVLRPYELIATSRTDELATVRTDHMRLRDFFRSNPDIDITLCKIILGLE